MEDEAVNATVHGVLKELLDMQLLQWSVNIWL